MTRDAEDRWSVAFFTCSNQRYEPSCLVSGEPVGTPEDAFDVRRHPPDGMSAQVF